MSGARRGARPLLATLALLGLAGCAAGPGRPAPTVVTLRADEADALVRQWETAWQAFTGLRAAVDLTVRVRDRSERNAALLLLAPRALRLEVSTPLGLPALVATADTERFTVFRPFDRRATTGPSTPAAIARWIGVPMPLETLTRLLAGYVPAPGDLATVRVDDRDGASFRYEANGLLHRVWVGTSGLPVRLLVDGPEPLVTVFARTVTGEVESLVVEAPRRHAELTVKFLQAEPVVAPAEAFELTLPPDVPLVPAD